MDFYVILKRPGSRVALKKRKNGRIGLNHRVTKDEAQNWFKTEYEGTLL